MVTTRPPKTIVKPTALGPVANTDTKLLVYGLFQKGRVLAQDGVLLPSSCYAARSICRLVCGAQPATCPFHKLELYEIGELPATGMLWSSSCRTF